MRDSSIGLLLFAFQIAYYGTLGHAIPVPYQIEDSILEEHRIVKRSGKYNSSIVLFPKLLKNGMLTVWLVSFWVNR